MYIVTSFNGLQEVLIRTNSLVASKLLNLKGYLLILYTWY